MIDKKTKSCKVTIFGGQYSLVTDESTDTVLQAAQLVDSIMQEIATKVAVADEKKCAVLAALRIASKVVLLESEIDKKRQKEDQLIELMKRELETDSSDSE